MWEEGALFCIIWGDLVGGNWNRQCGVVSVLCPAAYAIAKQSTPHLSSSFRAGDQMLLSGLWVGTGSLWIFCAVSLSCYVQACILSLFLQCLIYCKLAKTLHLKALIFLRGCLCLACGRSSFSFVFVGGVCLLQQKVLVCPNIQNCKLRGLDHVLSCDFCS